MSESILIVHPESKVEHSKHPNLPLPALTIFKNTKTVDGDATEMPWSYAFEKFKKPVVAASKADVRTYSSAYFAKNKRAKKNVISVSAIILEIDNEGTMTTTADAAMVWSGCYGLIVSSYSNWVAKQKNPTAPFFQPAPRFRIILPLSRAVTLEEYGKLWLWAERRHAAVGQFLDQAPKDASRNWFVPSCPPGMEDKFEWLPLEGEPLNPDLILSELPNEPTEIGLEPHIEPSSLSSSDRVKRAKKYLKKVPPAIEGQNGSAACFKAAIAAVKGFDLSIDEAMEALSEYNSRCSPPWSEADLRHKCDDADKASAPRGYLLKSRTKPLVRDDECAVADLYLSTLGPDVVFAEDHLYKYDGRVWRTIPEHEQTKAVKAFAGMPVINGDDGTYPLKLSSGKIKGALSLACQDVAQERFFDAFSQGLCFVNGVVVLRDKKLALVPHTSEQRFRFAYDFDYNPDLVSQKWLDFLDSLFDGDEDKLEKIHACQEFIGACLFGLAPKYKKCFVPLGGADNGKSAFIDVVRGIFPPGTTSTVAPHNWDNDYHRAALSGKHLNTDNELPSTDLTCSAEFKRIVAGDESQARQPHGRVFSFTPRAGHIFAANTLPRIIDKSKATFARMLVIEFNQTFSKQPTAGEKQAVIGLSDRILETEVPAILTWALQGLERLVRQGNYTMPASHSRVLGAWQWDSNPVEQFFDDLIEVSPNDKESLQKIYKRYSDWSMETGHLKKYARNTFGDLLTKLLERKLGQPKEVFKQKSNGTMAYHGIKLRPGPPGFFDADDLAKKTRNIPAYDEVLS